MSASERSASLAAGVVSGICGGCFGVGGGVALIPILTGRFRLTQHQAHGTSLAVIGVTAVVSALVYAAHGNVAWMVAVAVGLASALSARFGARLANRLSASALRRAFAIFMLLVAVRLLFDPQPAGIAVPHGLEFVVYVAVGLAVGILSGFMGVGGGILAVPAFTMLLGMTQAMAQGTSLIVILFAAPAGAWEHSRRGNVILRVVPWIVAGAAVAGPLAAWAVQGLPQRWLARAFAVFLIGMGIWTWVRADRADRAERARATTNHPVSPLR